MGFLSTKNIIGNFYLNQLDFWIERLFVYYSVQISYYWIRKVRVYWIEKWCRFYSQIPSYPLHTSFVHSSLASNRWIASVWNLIDLSYHGQWRRKGLKLMGSNFPNLTTLGWFLIFSKELLISMNWIMLFAFVLAKTGSFIS